MQNLLENVFDILNNTNLKKISQLTGINYDTLIKYRKHPELLQDMSYYNLHAILYTQKENLLQLKSKTRLYKSNNKYYRVTQLDDSDSTNNYFDTIAQNRIYRLNADYFGYNNYLTDFFKKKAININFSRPYFSYNWPDIFDKYHIRFKKYYSFVDSQINYLIFNCKDDKINIYKLNVINKLPELTDNYFNGNRNLSSDVFDNIINNLLNYKLVEIIEIDKYGQFKQEKTILGGLNIEHPTIFDVNGDNLVAGSYLKEPALDNYMQTKFNAKFIFKTNIKLAKSQESQI